MRALRYALAAILVAAATALAAYYSTAPYLDYQDIGFSAWPDFDVEVTLRDLRYVPGVVHTVRGRLTRKVEICSTGTLVLWVDTGTEQPRCVVVNSSTKRRSRLAPRTSVVARTKTYTFFGRRRKVDYAMDISTQPQ